MRQIMSAVAGAALVLGAATAAADSTTDIIIFEKWLPDASGQRWGDSVEIWSVRSDGSGLKQISSGAYDLGASWSPDRNRVAYSRADVGLRVVRLDDLSVLELNPGDRTHSPEWLDDRTLLYVAPGGAEEEFPSAWQLFSIALDDRSVSRVDIGGLKGIFSPTVSPNRKLLAFRALEEGRAKIFVADIEDIAGTRRLVLDEDGYTVGWAPDNSGILVLRESRCAQISVDGKVQRSFAGVEECHLSWSPSGDRIAFQHNGEIWIMDATGKNRRVLSKPTDGSHYHAPVWQ